MYYQLQLKKDNIQYSVDLLSHKLPFSLFRR